MPAARRLLPLLLALGCTPEPEKPPRETGPDTSPPEDTGPFCFEDATGDIPADVTWLTIESSGNLHAMPTEDHDRWGGLSTAELYAANGFKLDAPATVVGARVSWTNIRADDTPAVLTAWPDFSADGYAFDVWNPYGSWTRCVDLADDSQPVTYLFPEPIEVAQPLHVFVGFHRDAVADGEDGAPDFTEPELPWRAPLFGGGLEEPYVAGFRWPEVETSTYHGGMISPWYAFEVSLAVRYHDDLDPADKPFQLDGAFSASSRVAWGDYDNDGFDDLMTNGPTLWHNEGAGVFTNVTATAFPGGLSASTGGGVWGDYDNDGCLDYFGQGGGTSTGELLLHNECDGTFTDVTLASGIDDSQEEVDCNGDGAPEHSPTEGAAWLDFDGDGLLDIFLANYECWTGADTLGYGDRLFRNNGDGTFADVGSEVGLSTSRRQGRGATAGDLDRDGDVDLYVSNYRLVRNLFYDNLGDGTLDEVASANGTAGTFHSGYGSYGHTIGTVAGDIDNDGDFDLVVGNLAHPFFYHFSDRTQVLVNDGSGNFTDEAEERGIYYRETHSNPVLFDADNDGDLDLFITCVYSGRDSDFYENDGTGHFTLRNWESGLVVQNGWGAAAADYDNDGDVDLVAYGLYRNDLDNGHHWVQVRPLGAETNRSALGAVVQVEAGGLTQVRLVSGGSGTSSQDSPVQHFGLGEADSLDRITVWFPYQAEPVVVEDIAVDQRVWVQSDGHVSVGWDPPCGCE